MNDPARHQGRRTLLLLALVFLGPMLVAVALYLSDFEWRPGKTTEYGELYRPARPLSNVSFELLDEPGHSGSSATLQGKWTLIFQSPGACDQNCRQALIEIRQVRRALGRDMERVQRLFVVTEGAPDVAYLSTEHPGLGVLTNPTEIQALSSAIAAQGANEIFLADPLGNLVLRYPAGSTMKGMHKDLKHLLKISTVG
jgi:hypothetical protein